MPKKPQQSTPVQQPQQPPGFFSGIVFGAAIGAAGYYLFGTESGKKVKDQIIKAGKQQLAELDAQRAQLPKKTKQLKKKAATTKKQLKKSLDTKKKNLNKAKGKLIKTAKQIDKAVKKATS